MELKIFNARPLQKLFICSFIFILLFFWILIHILKGFSNIETELLLFVIFISFSILSIIIYFIIRNSSMIIFSSEGIIIYKWKKLYLNLKWNEISSIGRFSLFLPLFNFDWGPNFLEIEYNKNGKDKKIQLAISRKLLGKIKEKDLNPLINNLNL